MKTRALVVEDDPRDFAAIEIALVSLGHEYIWAKNQFDAERALAEHEFDYVLADLTIPARPRRSKPNPEFCLNFLDNLQKRRIGIPVIVLADRDAFVPDMVRDLIDLGAIEVVGKPFSAASRRLSMVICKVLRGDRPSISNFFKKGPRTQRRFAGGELVLHDDRAELCGVRVISDRGTGQCLQILDELRRRDANGRYVRRSAQELAVTIRALGGIATVTNCILRIRKNIVDRLGRELGIVCGREEVIQNNDQGYSLCDWITVRERGAPEGPKKRQPGTSISAVKRRSREAVSP